MAAPCSWTKWPSCGAIPGELMESEFFGHRKGSFSGAPRRQAPGCS
ncbi:hypothetical protein C7E12_21815, partial [Stenotrophomonas maltophilia]